MSRSSMVFATTVLMCWGQTAAALDIPRGNPHHHDGEFRGAHEFYKHLAGYGNVVVAADGTAHAWALFTSELKLQGRRKVALTTKLWSGSNVVAEFPFNAELADAMFHGGHEREYRKIDFALSPEQWKSVTNITYEFATEASNNCGFLQKKWEEGVLLVDPKVIGC